MAPWPSKPPPPATWSNPPTRPSHTKRFQTCAPAWLPAFSAAMLLLRVSGHRILNCCRHVLVLGALLAPVLRAAGPAPNSAAPRQAELGVYILDITDIDEPGG